MGLCPGAGGMLVVIGLYRGRGSSPLPVQFAPHAAVPPRDRSAERDVGHVQDQDRHWFPPDDGGAGDILESGR